MKFTPLLLFAALLFVVACGDDKPKTEDGTDTKTDSTQTATRDTAELGPDGLPLPHVALEGKVDDKLAHSWKLESTNTPSLQLTGEELAEQQERERTFVKVHKLVLAQDGTLRYSRPSPGDPNSPETLSGYWRVSEDGKTLRTALLGTETVFEDRIVLLTESQLKLEINPDDPSREIRVYTKELAL